MDYPGGFITKTAPILNPALGNAAPGVWRLNDVLNNIRAGTWPSYDPYFNYTTLLLHGNGTNGAQNNTFLDSSSNTFTITRNGDTTQGTFSPFSQTGWSNYLSNATGSYIVAANNSSYVFGTGDFTVEFWVYWPQPSTSSETRLMAIGSDYPSSGLGLVIYRASGDTCKARVLGNSTGGTEYTIASGASDWANKWVHMAVTRSGSTLRTFLNGTLITSASNSSDLNGTNGIQFGRYTGGGDLFTGYLSNVRLTKGGALYTASFTPPTAPLTTTVSSGTVGFLGFQSNRFVDNSGNNITLTPTGTPSVEAFSPFNPTAAYSAATVGGSGYFDGSGDYLSVADADALDLSTGDFTIQGWIYALSDAADADGIIGKRFTGGSFDGWRIAFDVTSGANRLDINHVSDGTERKTPAFNKNEWVHFAFTRTSGTLRCYANGVLGDSVAGYTYDFSNTYALLIATNVPSSSLDFPGYIAGLQILKGTSLYSGSTYTIPTSPPTNITNTSLLLNFTNAGIIDNTAKNDLVTVGNAQISTSVSKFGGGSMAFDGSGDWLAAPPTPQTDLGSGDFTLEAWLYRTASGATYDSGIVSRGAPSTLNGYAFGYTSANVLFFTLNYAGPVVTGVTAIPLNTWTHVAVSRNGNTFRLFVNGVIDATGTSSSSPTTNAGDIFYVGRSGYDSGRIVTGYLDDVRITKGVARYITNFTPQTSQWQDQ